MATASDLPTPRAPLALIIDDVEDNREMYAMYLEWLGYRVEGAGDGASGLEKALARRPDVIVLDLAMPRLDGWEVIRQLKADSRSKHIPLIVISGHVFADSERRARMAGCDVYLGKPCLPETVAAEIARLVGEAPARSCQRPA